MIIFGLYHYTFYLFLTELLLWWQHVSTSLLLDIFSKVSDVNYGLFDLLLVWLNNLFFNLCYQSVCLNHWEKYLHLSETQTIKEDSPGENDLIGSDITSTVKGASSEQKQNCKYWSNQTKVMS